MAFVGAPIRATPPHGPPKGIYVTRNPLESDVKRLVIRAKSDTVNTRRRTRAQSAPPRRLDVARASARQYAQQVRRAPQKEQWDALLAAALGEERDAGLWFGDEGASTGLLRTEGKSSGILRIGREETKPKRKPHGFWNDLMNVERELMEVNERLGRGGKKIVPRLTEMREMGRGDLIAAISKHGGVKKVAEALRWGRGGKNRRGGGKVEVKVERKKVMRRPRKYWDDVERVKSEIGAFIDEYGERGVMPTQRQFYAFERADLVQAAGRHGGLRLMAEEMGLRCRRRVRKMYWKDFEVLKRALVEFSKEYCGGKMPTGEELGIFGGSALGNAIVVHGGFPEVARKCGLLARNCRSQGAPVVWDLERLKVEIWEFLKKVRPEEAKEGIMPTERVLREWGRNDLSYAINKFGGFGKVAKIIGLKQKRFGVYSSKKRSETQD